MNIKLKTAQVPDAIREFAKQKLFGKNIRKFSLDYSGKVFIGIPWHEGDRNYFRMYKLDGIVKNKIVVSSSEREIEQNGWSEGFQTKIVEQNFEIPVGYIVAMVGIYPERCVIYTAKDAINSQLSEN